jgi:hypothetical protein|tara:strand:+ start:1281 stop:1508 length:228 start_codon:yes stop_codon:yes gene_type:complete
MAVDVAQKVKTGDDQPNGGAGIVSIAGARGLTAANKIDSNHSLSPPISASLIDQSIDVMYNNLNHRFDDYMTYST